MNTERLSQWVKTHLRDLGISKSELGRRTKITSQAIGKWVVEDVSALSPESIRKLAVYRELSPVAICEWLEIAVPVEFIEEVKASTLESRISDLESAQKEATELIGLLIKTVAAGAMRPSPFVIFLQDLLYESGYDVRSATEFQKAFEATLKALQGDKLLSLKVMAQFTGGAEITSEDITYISIVVSALVDRKWSTNALIDKFQDFKLKQNAH